MKQTIFKRAMAWLLVLAMVACLLPAIAPEAEASGYDNGYAGGMAGDGYIRAYGVDVSEHQGTGFNFNNIKNNGYSFVILRCGFVSRKDYRFEEYYANAKAVGLDVGVYFYSYATNASAASYEADLCLSYISGKQFEYPIYFDFEDPSANSGNGSTATSICNAFLSKIEAAGYLPGLYGYAGWMDPNYGAWVPTASICSRWECWIANYYNNTPSGSRTAHYPSTYGMYQYTSSNYVGGVGPLDTNVTYKDYPNIVKTYGFNGYGATGGASLPDGVYVIKTAVNADYAIDIEGGGASGSGANVHLWERHYGDSQRFVFQRAPGTSYYTIRNLATGRYLDLTGNVGSNGTNVEQYDYNGSDAQLWSVSTAADGTYAIRSKNGSKALDLTGGNVANGTNIEVWTYDGGVNLRWYLEPQNMLQDGIYKFGCNAGTNFVLNVAGNSSDDGGNVWLWERANDSHCRWVVQTSADGYCYIWDYDSVKYLDVNGGVGEEGTNVQIYGGNGSNAQKWSAIPNTDGTWSFASYLGGGLYLDVADGNAANGTDVRIWSGNFSDAQKWVAEPLSTIPDGVYDVQSKTDANQVLHIRDSSRDEGGVLEMQTYSNSPADKFIFEYAGDGLYTIRSYVSDRYLDLESGYIGCPPGHKVAQYGAWGGEINDNKLWSVVPNNDGSYNIVSKQNRWHLDRPNGANDNGTAVHTWTPNRGDPQKWRIVSDTIGHEGVYTIGAAADSSYVLDVEGGSTEQGGNVLVNQNGGADSQKWVVQTSGTNSYYLLHNLKSGRNLNAKGDISRYADGGNVLQYSTDTWEVEANEHWSIIPYPDGTVAFVNQWNGKYLDLSDGNLSNGNNVQTWGHYSDPNINQKWTLSERLKTVPDGLYTIVSAKDGNFAMDVASGTEEEAAADGSTIQIYSNHGGEMQKFAIEYVGDGLYTLRCTNHHKNMNVANGSTAYNSDIQQMSAGDAVSQKFVILPNANGAYTIASDLAITLDVEDGTMENGANIRAWGGNGSSAQQWNFVRTSTGKLDLSGQFAIVSAVDSKYTAEANGSNVQLGAKDGRANEIYEFKDLGNGCYAIYNTSTGKYVSASDNGVGLVSTNEPSDAEQWQVIPNADGTVTLVSKSTGKSFHLTGGTADDGKAIGLSDDGKCDASHWMLEAYTHVHNYTSKVTAPTCESRGYTTHTCTDCGDSYVDSYVDALGHNWNSGTVTKPATCTESGVKTFTCTRCQKSRTEVIAATGHTPVTIPGKQPTCTAHGLTEGSKCSKCGTILVAQQDIPATGHTEVTVPGKAATCTESGLTEGKKCSTCGAVIVAQQTIPALGHTEVTVPGKPATCTESGLTEGKRCSVCGMVIVAQQTIPAKGHTEVPVPGKAATCTETGLTDGTKCSVCGAVIKAQQTIPALGHSWDNGMVTVQPTCANEGKKVYTCTRCGETRSEVLPKTDHTATVIPGKTATCTEDGLTEGSKCAVCGTVLREQQTIPALGHNWDSGIVTSQPTCTVDGVRAFRCTRCGATRTEKIPATGHTAVTDPGKPATCTEPGLTEGSHCGVCGAVLVAQKPIEALGHDWDNGVSVPNETCPGASNTKYTCRRCGETRVVTNGADGHTAVTDPAKPATCTESGLTSGSHCEKCGAVIVPQEVIPPLGHSWNEGVITTDPTCTGTGIRTYTCTRCGETREEVMPANGHHIVTDPAKAPTCTESGLTAGSHCDVCGLVIEQQEEIPATGHKYELTGHKDCTEVEDGYDEFTCSVCGHKYRTAIPAPGCPSAAYTDVDRSKWYHESVDFMVSHGYMVGLKENYFGLSQSLTRAQLTAILYRIAGSPDVTDLTVPFTDINTKSYYYNAVRWAYDNGVVAGISETEFAPSRPITREQIASLLYRYKGSPEVTEDFLSAFPDAAQTHKYAIPAMNWAVSKGLLSGNKLNDGAIVLQPRNNATRAQCASILHRFCTNLSDAETGE